MLRNEYPLFLALIASLFLHGLPWLINQTPPAKPPPPPAPAFSAKLTPPPPAEITALPLPKLILPEPPKPEAASPPPQAEKQKPRDKPAPSIKTWDQAVARQLKQLNDRKQYYPLEAIQLGLQGEVLVLVIIDENGNITAARVEESSGHRILDEAALRNVRTIRSLPSDAPREALLPLRFTLR